MNAPMKFSVLSTRAANADQQVRLGGKIRSGIKLLTRNAESNPKAVAIYAEGVAKRQKFSEIEKRIKDQTNISNPMYPRNTPYFTVAASDFGMPEIASRIVEIYGEIRDGDTEKQLYRFPVVFHSDDLNEVYPNQFKRHGHEPHYESHYGEDGVRYCRYLPDITADQAEAIRIKRLKKVPRREKVIRGQCDPGACNEFGQGQCKFRGRLLFYVPGIPTTGLLGMETSSEYAAERIWSDLESIRDALGTLPRVHPTKPGEPIFWITKSLESRTYFDERGDRKNGFQWVPKLQADIDVGTLLTSGRANGHPAHQAPVAWLSQPKGMPDAILLPHAEDASGSNDAQVDLQVATGLIDDLADEDLDRQLAVVIDSMELERDMVMRYFDIKLAQSWENDDAHIKTAIKMLNDLSRYGNESAGKIIGISVKVFTMGISSPEFTAYSQARYGRGFMKKIEVLIQVEHEIDKLAKLPRDQAEAFIKQMSGTADATH